MRAAHIFVQVLSIVLQYRRHMYEQLTYTSMFAVSHVKSTTQHVLTVDFQTPEFDVA